MESIVLIIFAVGWTVLSIYLFKNRERLNVEYKGASPEVITTFSVIVGIFLFGTGIIGLWNADLSKRVLEFSDRLYQLSEITGFLLINVFIFSMLIYGLIKILLTIAQRRKDLTLMGVRCEKKELAGFLGAFGFFSGLLIIYWIWVTRTNRFEDFYMSNFEYFFGSL